MMLVGIRAKYLAHLIILLIGINLFGIRVTFDNTTDCEVVLRFHAEKHASRIMGADAHSKIQWDSGYDPYISLDLVDAITPDGRRLVDHMNYEMINLDNHEDKPIHQDINYWFAKIAEDNQYRYILGGGLLMQELWRSKSFRTAAGYFNKTKL